MKTAVATMCEDCTCCRQGACTTLGRFAGYCPPICPCEPVDDSWLEYEPKPLNLDDDS